jgi:DNA-binding YbaB/EbfC family protein
MNMQAIMQQAQKMQKDVMKAKKEIDETVFTGKSSFVTAEVYGSKKIKKITIDSEKLEKDDIAMLEDLVLVAVNDAMNQIDVETEKKLGKYTGGMQGLL